MLAPNAHIAWNVDAGFHREAHTPNQQAVIPGLEVVQVRSASMELNVHGVAGPMHEKLTEIPVHDEPSAHVVDLVATYLPALLMTGAQKIDTGLVDAPPERPPR